MLDKMLQTYQKLVENSVSPGYYILSKPTIGFRLGDIVRVDSAEESVVKLSLKRRIEDMRDIIENRKTETWTNDIKCFKTSGFGIFKSRSVLHMGDCKFEQMHEDALKLLAQKFKDDEKSNNDVGIITEVFSCGKEKFSMVRNKHKLALDSVREDSDRVVVAVTLRRYAQIVEEFGDIHRVDTKVEVSFEEDEEDTKTDVTNNSDNNILVVETDFDNESEKHTENSSPDVFVVESDFDNLDNNLTEEDSPDEKSENREDVPVVETDLDDGLKNSEDHKEDVLVVETDFGELDVVCGELSLSDSGPQNTTEEPNVAESSDTTEEPNVAESSDTTELLDNDNRITSGSTITGVTHRVPSTRKVYCVV